MAKTDLSRQDVGLTDALIIRDVDRLHYHSLELLQRHHWGYAGQSTEYRNGVATCFNGMYSALFDLHGWFRGAGGQLIRPPASLIVFEAVHRYRPGIPGGR